MPRAMPRAMPVNPHSKVDDDWTPGSKKRRRSSAQISQQSTDGDADDDIQIVAVTGPTKTKSTPKAGYVTRTRTGAVTPRSHAKQPKYIPDEPAPTPTRGRGRHTASASSTPDEPAPTQTRGRGRPPASSTAASSTAASVKEPATPTPGKRGRPPAGSSTVCKAKGKASQQQPQQPQQPQQQQQQQQKQPIGPFVDLMMECHDEPLSKVQQEAFTQAKEKYDRSQQLIKAAKEGRLLFSVDGTPNILAKPLPPPTRPAPAHLLPPPVEPEEEAAVPEVIIPEHTMTAENGVSSAGGMDEVYPQQMYPAAQMPRPMSSPQASSNFKPPVRSDSPDLMIVAETPPPPGGIRSRLESPRSRTLYDKNGATPVHGTSGMGIRLPPGWTNAAPMISGPPTNPPWPQSQEKSKSPPETSNKKSKKDEGNWVPLDEYYYGKTEGNPTYLEDKGEFRFKCWYCCKMLYNNVAAMTHIQGHIDSEKQVNLDLTDLTNCKHCFKTFDTPFEMQTHMEKVHITKANVLLCRICEKDHDSRRSLTDHMHKYHNACEMPYVCQLCNFRSSMYSDVVDHFKKKHSASCNMLCLYCLRVFQAKLTSQGWGQTTAYYNHLMKHQVRTSYKKCPLCKLVFLNSADLKIHRTGCHMPNVKGAMSMSNKYSTPDQVMIKLTESTEPKGSIKSLNVAAVTMVVENRLALPKGLEASCVECKAPMITPGHYKKFIQCSMCRFATSCSHAYTSHMLGFHSGQQASDNRQTKEAVLEDKLYCVCGYSSFYGNKLAAHMVSCSKRTCFKDPPPPFTAEEFGKELKDPRKKPDASLLDVLGLVKKDELSASRVNREPTPPPYVEMPDVKLSDMPPRRPSLLMDAKAKAKKKSAFKTILQEVKDQSTPDEIKAAEDIFKNAQGKNEPLKDEKETPKSQEDDDLKDRDEKTEEAAQKNQTNEDDTMNVNAEDKDKSADMSEDRKEPIVEDTLSEKNEDTSNDRMDTSGADNAEEETKEPKEDEEMETSDPELSSNLKESEENDIPEIDNDSSKFKESLKKGSTQDTAQIDETKTKEQNKSQPKDSENAMMSLMSAYSDSDNEQEESFKPSASEIDSISDKEGVTAGGDAEALSQTAAEETKDNKSEDYESAKDVKPKESEEAENNRYEESEGAKEVGDLENAVLPEINSINEAGDAPLSTGQAAKQNDTETNKDEDEINQRGVQSKADEEVKDKESNEKLEKQEDQENLQDEKVEVESNVEDKEAAKEEVHLAEFKDNDGELKENENETNDIVTEREKGEMEKEASKDLEKEVSENMENEVSKVIENEEVSEDMEKDAPEIMEENTSEDIETATHEEIENDEPEDIDEKEEVESNVKVKESAKDEVNKEEIKDNSDELEENENETNDIVKDIDKREMEKDSSKDIEKEVSEDIEKEVSEDMEMEVSEDMEKEAPEMMEENTAQNENQDVSEDIETATHEEIEKDETEATEPIEKEISEDFEKDIIQDKIEDDNRDTKETNSSKDDNTKEAIEDEGKSSEVNPQSAGSELKTIESEERSDSQSEQRPEELEVKPSSSQEEQAYDSQESIKSGKQSHERSVEKDGSKEKDKEREREKERERQRRRSRSRERKRSRSRERKRSRSRSRDKDRHRDRDRERNHDRDRDRNKDRHYDNRDRDRDHHRDRDRHRDRDYDRDRDYKRHRDDRRDDRRGYY